MDALEEPKSAREKKGVLALDLWPECQDATEKHGLKTRHYTGGSQVLSREGAARV
jgi:hypothetical protein